MSPNGRRRFRKMNRRFRQRGPARVRERARQTNGGKARKMILVQWWGRDPLPLPPKPFTPRSLVGMTQGARKRAIRRVLRSEMPSCYRIPGAFYRIGERLRPCPGCCACGAIEPGNEYPIPWCDGSGVLPARTKGEACLHRGIAP